MRKVAIGTLSIVHILALFLITAIVFPNLNLMPESWIRSVSIFGDSLFYRSLPVVFFFLLIVFSASLVVIIVGYNMLRKRRVEGTLTYTFGFMLDLALIAFGLAFSFLSIVFSGEIALPTKVILAILYVVLLQGVFFTILEKIVDTVFFFSDVFKERHEYAKLSYSIEKDANMTHFRINTAESPVFSKGYHSVLSGAPSLIIEKALFETRKTGPISIFLSNVFSGFLLSQFTQTTVWPRARAFFFRNLARAKIGRNCFIGQWTKFDPILPDLIEFEGDCGVGTGCTILTHSYIGYGRMTFSFGPVKICRNVRVGANCLILPGVTIGEGALVASGSVVAKDVPPYAFVAGSPAKVQKRRIEEKLE